MPNIPEGYIPGSSDYPTTGRGKKMGETKFVPIEDITEDHLPPGWGAKSPEELLEEAEEARIEGGASEYADLEEKKPEDEEDVASVEDQDNHPKKVGVRKMVSVQKDFPYQSVKDVRQEKSSVRGKNSK